MVRSFDYACHAIKTTSITIEISYCPDANNLSMQNRVFQKYSHGTVTPAHVEISITQPSCPVK